MALSRLVRFYGGDVEYWESLNGDRAAKLLENAGKLEAEERLNRITDSLLASNRAVPQNEYYSVVRSLERKATEVRGLPLFSGFESARAKASEMGLV